MGIHTQDTFASGMSGVIQEQDMLQKEAILEKWDLNSHCTQNVEKWNYFKMHVKGRESILVKTSLMLPKKSSGFLLWQQSFRSSSSSRKRNYWMYHQFQAFHQVFNNSPKMFFYFTYGRTEKVYKTNELIKWSFLFFDANNELLLQTLIPLS